MVHAVKLTLTPESGGQLFGEGPGWYRGWMIPKSNGSMFDQRAPAPRDPNERTITGIHLVFNDSMQGDMFGRHLDFLRGVRVGVRSVASWEQSLTLGRWMPSHWANRRSIAIDCDSTSSRATTTIADSRECQRPGRWKRPVVSSSERETIGACLEGTASRAAYSSSKDLFTVEGAPNRAAIFRQTRPDGSPGPEGAFRNDVDSTGHDEDREYAVIERLNIATPAISGTR